MLPIIDIKTNDLDDVAELHRLAGEIGDACRRVGFFYLRGHGLDGGFPQAFDLSRRFFAEPENEKAKLAISPTSGNRGYVGLDTESLDPSAPVDRKEAFNIRLNPDDAGTCDHSYWPKTPGFRDVMSRYFVDVYRLGLQVHRAIALDLGMPADYFDPFLKDPMATLRLLHYPAASTEPDGALGAGEHTDYGNLTILLTDDAGGLEVRRRDGTWLPAPYVPGAYVCNIGDCLMRWTNDDYVSTSHRVVTPRNRERFSIPFFLDPNADAMVAPLYTCVSPDQPARYEPIAAGRYFASRFAATYGF